MGPELTAQFDEVSDETGLTRAEIFRRAVALYRHAKKIQMRSGKVIMQRPDGSSYELTGL